MGGPSGSQNYYNNFNIKKENANIKKNKIYRN